MSHSPGPWKACHNGDCVCGQVWCNDYPVAAVTIGTWGDTFAALRFVDGGEGSIGSKVEAYTERIDYGSVGEETAKANARLIAAAPDMLAALNAVIGEWREGYGLRCEKQVRAAIGAALNGYPDSPAMIEAKKKLMRANAEVERAKATIA